MSEIVHAMSDASLGWEMSADVGHVDSLVHVQSGAVRGGKCWLSGPSRLATIAGSITVLKLIPR